MLVCMHYLENVHVRTCSGDEDCEWEDELGEMEEMFGERDEVADMEIDTHTQVTIDHHWLVEDVHVYILAFDLSIKFADRCILSRCVHLNGFEFGVYKLWLHVYVCVCRYPMDMGNVILTYWRSLIWVFMKRYVIMIIRKRILMMSMHSYN